MSYNFTNSLKIEFLVFQKQQINDL
ncbi:MAG: hypothetical protein RIR39_1174, partial [Pseudomonadota bacterium]